jgi:hypothetical protein
MKRQLSPIASDLAKISLVLGQHGRLTTGRFLGGHFPYGLWTRNRHSNVRCRPLLSKRSTCPDDSEVAANVGRLRVNTRYRRNDYDKGSASMSLIVRSKQPSHIHARPITSTSSVLNEEMAK